MKLTLNILERRDENEDKRWPHYVFGGRLRTSTLALMLVFLAVWWVHQTTQIHRDDNGHTNTKEPTPQVVPPGFVPDPNYTWVPRTRVDEKPTVTTPTTTEPTTTTRSPTTTTPPPFVLPTLPCIAPFCTPTPTPSTPPQPQPGPGPVPTSSPPAR